MSKTDRLLKLLTPGKNVSVQRCRQVTKLKNIYSTINRLRSNGLVIYTNRQSKGNFYRWGNPEYF